MTTQRCKTFDSKEINPDDVRLCNCCECGKELLGESMIQFIGAIPAPYNTMQFVEERTSQGRPLCHTCSISGKRLPISPMIRGGREVTSPPPESTNPSYDNGIRALEGE